jgi:hypothetical protein
MRNCACNGVFTSICIASLVLVGCDLGRKDHEEKISWEFESGQFAIPVGTNYYSTDRQDYPDAGIIHRHVEDEILDERGWEAAVSKALQLCRSDFQSAYRSGELISNTEDGSRKPFPVKLVVVLFRYHSPSVDNSYVDLDDVRSNRLRSAFLFRAEDVFSDMRISELYRGAFRKTPGWHSVISPDNVKWVYDIVDEYRESMN